MPMADRGQHHARLALQSSVPAVLDGSKSGPDVEPIRDDQEQKSAMTEPEPGKGSLPLADNGKAVQKKIAGAKAAGPGPYRRFKLWRLPLLMIFLFSGAVAGMYFQPPLLRAFFGWTGLEPGAGTRSPMAVPAPPPVAEGHACPL